MPDAYKKNTAESHVAPPNGPPLGPTALAVRVDCVTLGTQKSLCAVRVAKVCPRTAAPIHLPPLRSWKSARAFRMNDALCAD
ncbi:hypothetical protein QR680_001813 [Steinernema hermaphroditum]|uniref:Uncharacterized protein n=1 Tax=Steinernema hermaphroditum TaxID=289476 RepID=A0AA39H005_9BILA|nr:hypothetical protein QR680_001813 [Steinernema hermaphroditum]